MTLVRSGHHPLCCSDHNIANSRACKPGYLGREGPTAPSAQNTSLRGRMCFLATTVSGEAAQSVKSGFVRFVRAPASWSAC